MAGQYPYQNISLIDIPSEEWKDVIGYDYPYKISNFGRVKIIEHYIPRGHFIKTRIVKQRLNKNQYPIVSLPQNGIHRPVSVHRLVALYFVDNPEKHDVVDHIDTDRKNNLFTNLRWCSTKDNVNNPITKEHLSQSAKRFFMSERGREHQKFITELASKTEAKEKRIKKVQKAVIQKDLEGNFIKEFKSVKDAIEQTHCYGVGKCCRKIWKSSHGFIWEFKN